MRSFLPDTTFLFGEEAFADFALFWDEKGMYAKVLVKKKCEACFYPDFQKGDSIELFIDTRDVKTAHSLNEFCHHFVFLPQELEGFFCGYEVTRFVKESAHALADSNLFKVQTTLKRFSYEMEITLPKEALFGYDPTSCPRIGFTYRINRYGKASQHFAVSSKFYAFETRPELWASLECVKNL